MPEIVKFPGGNLADVPKNLRKLADDIEAGVYGEVGCCAISMIADQLCVFSYGPDSGPPSAGMVLFAGGQFLLQNLLEHGQDE